MVGHAFREIMLFILFIVHCLYIVLFCFSVGTTQIDVGKEVSVFYKYFV